MTLAADQLRSECAKLNELANGALALLDYSLSLASNQIAREGSRFVMRPDNFVTFEPHWKRSNNLTITIRGNPSEYEETDSLSLSVSMNGYSSFKIEHLNQMAAAFSYVRRAYGLFAKGRNRIQTTPKTIEI